MEKQDKIVPDAYICEECEALITVSDAEEAGPLYECGECGEVYNRNNSMDGDSNHCPNCNRFGAKIADRSCPECEQGTLAILLRG